MQKSTTPKFDALVAKFRKAGHNVKVTETMLPDSIVYTMTKGASVNGRCLANVSVFRGGNIESMVRNTKFKITDKG